MVNSEAGGDDLVTHADNIFSHPFHDFERQNDDNCVNTDVLLPVLTLPTCQRFDNL